MYFIILLLWKTFAYGNVYCVGTGRTTLMSISDGSDPYLFRRNFGTTRSVKEKMDGEVFISQQTAFFLYK